MIGSKYNIEEQLLNKSLVFWGQLEEANRFCKIAKLKLMATFFVGLC